MSKCGPDGKITLASVYMTIFAPGSHPNNHDGDDVYTHIGKVFANDKIWQLAR